MDSYDPTDNSIKCYDVAIKALREQGVASGKFQPMNDAEKEIAPQTFLDGKVTLLSGDSAELIKSIPDNSIDSVVCDPPYALVSIVKRFGSPNAAPAKGNEAYMRASAGFMGKQWDTGEVAFDPAFWAEVLRVLKPGGHLVAFSGTRTYHRMAVAIEDAGFEIRDQLAWCYGSGFPKSHNVSKNIDKAAGAQREIVGERKKLQSYGANEIYGDGPDKNGIQLITAPCTDDAKKWDGWGTALKPAWEPICLGRKAVVGTVADNVLTHGTGAINIDGCRVETAPDDDIFAKNPHTHGGFGHAGAQVFGAGKGSDYRPQQGRWPANLLLDGSEEVLAAFPETGISSGGSGAVSQKTALAGHVYGEYSGATLGQNAGGLGDSGSAARFFYTAKADAEDRLGSKHPTVKPLDLMQWLVRLVTPKNGTCLDPFAGTGTTGEAAWREGMRAVLMEREPEYQRDIKKRMELADRPMWRDAAARAKKAAKVVDDSPTVSLFGAEDA